MKNPCLIALLFLIVATKVTIKSQPAPPALSPIPAATLVTRQETPDIWLNQKTYFRLFSPFRTDRVAMSPDGSHFAYTIHEDHITYVHVVATSAPETLVAAYAVATDATSTAYITNLSENEIAQVRWMRWTSPRRLVVETNTNSVINNANYRGKIFAIDITDQTKIHTVTARDFTVIPPATFPDRSLGAWPQNSFTTPNPAFRGENRLQSEDEALRQMRSILGMGRNTYPNANNPALPGTNTIGADRARIAYLAPRVFNTVPDKPDLIYISARNQNTHYLYTFNVATGKLKLDAEKPLIPDTSVLLNQQGRPAIYISNTLKNRFPFHYTYEKNAGLLGRVNLSKITDKHPSAPEFTLSPRNFFAGRSIPLAFDKDATTLYYASNINRNTYGIYSFNLKTRKPGSLAIENPDIDLVTPSTGGYVSPNPLIFDPHTHELAGIRIDSPKPTTRWFRPELQDAQQFLENNLPGRIVDIIDWDNSATRIILVASNVVDSGIYYLYNRETSQITGFANRGSYTAPERLPIPFNFDIANPNAPGSRLTGTITIPRRARVTPLPAIVYCPADPWLRPIDKYRPANSDTDTALTYSSAYSSANYQPEIRALADMGFAVVQINTRGTWGNGTRSRLAAIEGGFDIVQTQDILATLDRLADNFKINLKRVAIYGSQRGGYLALRAAQQHPDRFKCVIATEPVIDIARWLATMRWTTGFAAAALTRDYFGADGQIKLASVKSHPEQITCPTLLLCHPGLRGGARTQNYLDARQLTQALKRHNTPVVLFELSDDFQAGLPGAHTSTFSKIETFLNEYIYRYDIDYGEIKQMGSQPTDASRPKSSKK